VIYLLRLAMRNALRNVRRSAFTMVSLFLGVGIFVAMQGMVDGLDRTVIRNEVRSDHGHVRIMQPAYLADEDYLPLDLPVIDLAGVKAWIKDQYPASKTVARAGFMAEIGDGVRSLRVRGFVVDPADYQTVLPAVEFTEPRANGQAVWVGADLAAAFSLEPGSSLFLKSKTHKGTLNAVDDLVVAGLIDSGNPKVDNFTIILPTDVGYSQLDIDASFATELLVAFPDGTTAAAFDAQFSDRFPGLIAETWSEKLRPVLELNATRRTLFSFIILIILLIGASGVANTCLMSGFERSQEIGTLRAIGYPRRNVLTLLLAESTVIGLVGAALGVLVAGSVVYYFSIHGLALIGTEDAEGAMPVPPLIFFQFDLRILLYGLLIGTGISVIASLIPAWKISGLDPVVALREEV
jgi:putative ABC transport system permease protein